MIKQPLRTGPDIDWSSKCHPGDSQGETDACSVFAIANWVECMTGLPISNEASIAVWDGARILRRDGGSALAITEAFAAAYRAGWLLPGTQIRRVANLQPLSLAPLVIGVAGLDWSIPPGTYRLNRVDPGTNHAVLAIADKTGDIWIENSHGERWGHHGFGCMSHDVFRRHVTQIWQIIPPDAPTTEEEDARKQAGEAAKSIGTQVRSIARNLAILGYSLPGNGGGIMTDVLRRSMEGTLSPLQNEAKRDLADVYLLLRGGGVTDAKINAVWEVIK